MKMAVELADWLEQKGKSVSIVSVHTMKPLDRTGIEAALKSHRQVIVIEEHAPQGGLAAQTKQIAWDSKAQCDLKTFTLQDEFIHNYGSHDDLLAAHGLDVGKISQQLGL
jgi:transketolase